MSAISPCTQATQTSPLLPARRCQHRTLTQGVQIRPMVLTFDSCSHHEFGRSLPVTATAMRTCNIIRAAKTAAVLKDLLARRHPGEGSLRNNHSNDRANKRAESLIALCELVQKDRGRLCELFGAGRHRNKLSACMSDPAVKAGVDRPRLGFFQRPNRYFRLTTGQAWSAARRPRKEGKRGVCLQFRNTGGSGGTSLILTA